MDYDFDMINILDNIGHQGPVITFFITFLNLLNQKKYLLSFLICIFINHYLNTILKLIIREPRPGKKRDMSNLLIDLVGKPEKLDGNNYGMPSYHAQSVFFSTSFLYLVQKNPIMLLLESVICCLTLYQRYKYKRHDMRQLVMGALVGTGFAYLCFTLTNQYLSKQ
jgi:membrane-associated phospholipid phosphatase